jgi:trehalose/maltose transport system substrate-binding protein
MHPSKASTRTGVRNTGVPNAGIAPTKMGWTLGIVLLLLFECGCHTSGQKPATLTYFRLGWSQPDDLPATENLSEQFTRQTGIHLRDLPVPEATLDQLSLSRKLLAEPSSHLDVLNIDVIWTGVLEPDLTDLRPELADTIALVEPQLLASYEVEGKLLAIPYTVQVGVLEYRSDLLREYGYRHPPRTWDELERMAARIQSGERAKGNHEFWGYVWQGAEAEALACNALEWQAGEGGGRVIETNRSISVNNPGAIQAWQRAKRWIGWISPPSVLAYQELDSINVFDKGQAAFGRVWGGAPITRMGLLRQLHWRSSLAESKTGYTSIPGGTAEGAGTLGGSGLSISRSSVHPKEATELVRFLIRSQTRSNLEESAVPRPPVTDQESSAGQSGHPSDHPFRNMPRLVIRPSGETGKDYEQVTRAYIAAVHSVLAGEKSASVAASNLENELLRITKFGIGPPLKDTDPPATR